MHTTTQKPKQLSSAKRALLEKLRQGRLKKKQADTQGIPRYTDDGPLPLSFAQQRLWFLEQFEGGHPTYNEPLHARLNGPLDADALERTLHEIARRHHTLRSCFKTVEGRPVKEVLPELTLKLPVEDLRRLSSEQRDETVKRRRRENACRVFDLSQAPLFRADLLRVADEEYLLLLTFHHIVYDGWSINVLMHELKTLYEAFSAGRPSPLPELPIQYADFARWQRDVMQGEVEEKQMAYWREKLKGPIPTLDLPTDYPRPPQQSFKGEKYHFQLPKTLSDKLDALSQQEKCTLSMLTLAAFKVLLYRYTGQEDILIGSAVANRTRREVEPLIGMFVNTLVLRTDLSGNPTFLELLQRVRQTLLDAQGHQELPFDLLVEELLPQRDLSHTPFFQAWFNFQNFEIQQFSLGEASLQEIPFHTETAKFDLNAQILNSTEGFQVFIEYNTALFHGSSIQRLAGHFQMLLEGIAAQPSQRITELPFLTASEQKQILEKWNNTNTEYPRERCVHELFEAQVERTPQAIAAEYQGAHLSYRELNRRANHVAHYLRKRGVRQNVLVGLCVKRSLDAIVGILGVMKAGGAYVPLDHTHPKQRLKFMLEDMQPPIILTQANVIDALPDHDAAMLCLDTDWPQISQEPSENPKSLSRSSDLIYVIYTSGSTGEPKGVMVPHQGVVNYLLWCIDAYHVSEGIGAPVNTPLGFDATVTSLFAPLLIGKRIVFIPEENEIDAFLDILRSTNNFSLIKITPAYLAALGQSLRPEDAAGKTRAFIIGGEALLHEHVVFWRQYAPDTVLINEYGPTETVVGCCVHTVSNNTPVTASVPIGKPIANTQLYILDASMVPVPVGVPGELYIGGDGVTQGYLHRPGLTAERFITDPFRSTPDACLYKTGDLARYLPDGEIVFLGRFDHQVKVRGFRIELGEIETALTQHAEIRESAVVTRNDTSGNQQLAAYIVTHSRMVFPNDLREWLQQRLPDYMIPTSFTAIPAIPLTSNGKVDRRALPESDVQRVDLTKTYTAPRNAIEQLISEIWTETLHIERIGTHDNFFELGGHSLSAMQLVAKLSKAFNATLSVKDIFLFPTITKLQIRLADMSSPIEQKDIESPTATATTPWSPSEEQTTLYQFEARPLLSLLAARKIPPVDAAFLDYPSKAILNSTGLSRNELIQFWCHDMATVYNIVDTAWGRSAGIMLPLLDAELFSEKEMLLTHIIDALEIAASIGARSVTLTGLLGFATDYGLDVVQAIAEKENMPDISTGHAAISAAYLLNIESLLQRAGRSMTQERVAFIDLGSLGSAVLRLMLRCLPHPKEIILCDLSYRACALKNIRRELENDSVFHGTVRVAPLEAGSPSDIYDATLFVSAFNISDMLDITLVKPGTLIVNPNCFNSAQLKGRFEEREDILFTSGGVLKTPQLVNDLSYRPATLANNLQASHLEAFNSKAGPYDIPGCTFSSILASCVEELQPTTGPINDETAFQHYEYLHTSGCRGVDLHIGNYILPEASVQSFYRRFRKNA